MSSALKGFLKTLKSSVPSNIPPVTTPAVIPTHVELNHLPKPIKLWVQHALRRRYSSAMLSDSQTPVIETRTDDLDPEASDTLQIEGSSSSFVIPPPRLTIPNPFIRHRQRIITEDFSEDPKTRYRNFHPIKKREQKKMILRYPTYLLPPSQINPLDSHPSIRSMFQGREVEVEWGPDWRTQIKLPKGLYAGRAIIFKGHKRERDLPVRRQEIQERVDGMDRRIEKWRDVSAAALEVRERVADRTCRRSGGRDKKRDLPYHGDLYIFYIAYGRLCAVNLSALSV